MRCFLRWVCFASKSGEGERLGTAYRLKSGEIIYVRDKVKGK
jgi:hypothetical protein